MRSFVPTWTEEPLESLPDSHIIPIDVATQIVRISSNLYQVVVEIHKRAGNSLIETGIPDLSQEQISEPLPMRPFYRCWSTIPSRIAVTNKSHIPESTRKRPNMSNSILASVRQLNRVCRRLFCGIATKSIARAATDPTRHIVIKRAIHLYGETAIRLRL